MGHLRLVTPQEAFEELREHMNGIDDHAAAKVEVHSMLVVICPDCGKHAAHNNRCPKCGGESWVQAGAGGTIENRNERTHTFPVLPKKLARVVGSWD